MVNVWKDDVGRFVMAQFSFLNISFRVVCLYSTKRNPARDDFFVLCGLKIDPSIPTVVGGDFNAVFNRQLDRRGSDAFDLSRESCMSLRIFFDESAMIDISRSPSTL